MSEKTYDLQEMLDMSTLTAVAAMTAMMHDSMVSLTDDVKATHGHLSPDATEAIADAMLSVNGAMVEVEAANETLARAVKMIRDKE